tara:strand:- start:271 stop:1032 length:762 start_codon:yes stop_codon:yes gene_type:complete
MSGWIKLHRQIEQNWIWHQPHTLRLFSHLLLGAATEAEAIYRNLRTGQLRTTYAALADALKYGTNRDKLKTLSRRELGRMIEQLVEASMISCESSREGLLVTVTNYDAYQGGRSEASLRAPVDPSWKPDPAYDSGEALQRYIEAVHPDVGELPVWVSRVEAENALALLHRDDHYSAEEIYRAIDQIKEHRAALDWVVRDGPARLRKLTPKNKMTMDVVLAWKKMETKHGKRKLYTGSTEGSGTDGLEAALGSA